MLHDPTVSFRVGGKRFEGRARVVDAKTEDALSRRVSSLMDGRYHWMKA